MATACDVCGRSTGLIQDTVCGERVFLMPLDYDTGPTCVECQEWGMKQHLEIESVWWWRMNHLHPSYITGVTA